MRRYLLVLLLLTSISTQSVAQQQQQQPLGPPVPEELTSKGPRVFPPLPLQVVQGTQALEPYDRIMYVLDVSCSMSSKLADAVPVVDVFASDSFKAAVVTFADSHERWEGVPCEHPDKKPHTNECTEPGWVWMPLHRIQMFQHLRAFSGGGGTDPTSALTHAVREAPKGTLIVFISDGDFGHTDGVTNKGEISIGPLTALKAAQAWRREKKLPPVQILVWATSERDSKQKSLIELAKLGGGGLWRADTRQSGPW